MSSEEKVKEFFDSAVTICPKCGGDLITGGNDDIVIHNYKLPIDVTIGNGTFKKGVHIRLVLERLHRQFKYDDINDS